MYFNQNSKKVYYGWYIVIACFLITLYTGGTVHLGFTAVFRPIAEEFHWSYAQVSLVASFRGLEIGFFAPFVGILVDRLGPRRLTFGGGMALALGLVILSQTSSLGMFYGAFAIIAIGIGICIGIGNSLV